MPYKLTRPPRDLAKVKCVKKTKDKNGEVHFDLKVMFNYVSIWFQVEFNPRIVIYT
jgi:hypothetical protein